MPTQPCRVSVLDDVGNADAPPGSAPWAKWMVGQAKLRRQELERDVTGLQDIIKKLEKHDAWKPLGFASFGLLCISELNLDDAELNLIRGARRGATLGAVLAQATTQGERTDIPESGKLTQAERAEKNGVGCETQRYLDRLARDRPDLLDRVNAGELKPWAAAREAGIVKVPTPLDLLKRAWNNASKGEKDTFMDWANQLGW